MTLGELDPSQLPLFANCASLALARRPQTAATSITDFLDAVAGHSRSRASADELAVTRLGAVTAV